MFGALIRNGLRGQNRLLDEFAFDSTLFSLINEVPRPTEGRAGERLLAMLPVARLVSEEGQDLCRIRNISAAGLMAETGRSHCVGTRVRVEFNSHQQLPGEVAWTRETSCGIKFDRDCNLRELLANRPARRTGQTPRPPRLDIGCNADLVIDGILYRTQIRDISLGGFKASVGNVSCVGKDVVARIESLRQVRGLVRWHKDGHAGIVFKRPLAFEELAEWMGRRVEVASLKAGAWTKPERR
jgi:hypothetical protein